jgi:ferrous iron transport protein B
MRLALVGQPNCGKSTLFNQVAGYKAHTGNFPGTSVTYIESKVRVQGETVHVVDLPGTYTLAGSNPAERVPLQYLASNEVDVVINVIDATHLAQGLDMTLELLELQRPMVVAVNLVDEAVRLGLHIDGPALQARLGVPVLPLVASKGRGVRALFREALLAGKAATPASRPRYSRDVELAVEALASGLRDRHPPIHPDATALKLLEDDSELAAAISRQSPSLARQAERWRQQLSEGRGQPARWVIWGERHGLAGNLEHAVVTQGPRRITWRDRLDDVLLHPVGGYLALLLILYGFFQAVYATGQALEGPLLAWFTQWGEQLRTTLGGPSLTETLATGLLQGIAGGAAIVLPYMVPFLIGLGFLEDIGYMPRLAFLMDALMHRLGLHGKSVVPFILGYGCTVPAVMATRILENRRDRFLAALLSTLIPCSARLVVVFGLVAATVGPAAAAGIYLLNLFVIALTGRVLSGMLGEDSPGLILEIPPYRLPAARTVLAKVWYRIREFIVDAWPVLIAGSALLAILSFYNLAGFVDGLVRPFTCALGLPAPTGTPLLFGILRKELSLVMLGQALGTLDFGLVLSLVQMITFAVFVVFYVPCLATLVVLRREFGWKATGSIALVATLVALVVALIVRGGLVLVGI